ncbi:Gldg family protein [Entomospira entomophila]|uniref:ABC-type uncharacterized transport system domain-containing protein n=1 Tax=Entomospira entomophila TaxID=2719988 RepID=A0A968G7R8_9SPIO|nr:Gldg family protein [Entomospira entomophilus]NIZ40167.1 hypothetical protein [Entomospira entomophilus]WDI35725.1 Gldg family protein [Entomospira entomophilus]
MRNNSYSRKYAQYSFIRSIVFIAAIITLVWFISLWNIQIDLTRDQRYTISLELNSLLQKLEMPLHIYYLVPDSLLTQDGIAQVHHLLRQVAEQHPSVEYSNFPPEERALFLSEFINREQRIETGSLILRTGSRYHMIDPFQLLNYQDFRSGALVLTANNTEQFIANTVAQFLDNRRIEIFTPNNHGELSLGNIMTSQNIPLDQLLSQQGYTISSGHLETSSLDHFSTILFLAPTSDISVSEYGLLQRWLADGKNIYLSLPFQRNLPFNLQKLLDNVGIIVENATVIELNENQRIASDSDQLAFLGTLNPHAITESLAKQNLRPIIRMPLKISLSSAHSQQLKQELIIASSPSTEFLRLNEESQQIETLANPRQEITPIALAITQSNSRASTARFYFISGDSSYLSHNYPNELLMQQALIWLHQQEYHITIPPKNLYTSPMRSITQRQAIALGILFTLFIPIVLLVSALLVYHTRRKN